MLYYGVEYWGVYCCKMRDSFLYFYCNLIVLIWNYILEYIYEIKCKCEILILRIYVDLLNNVFCGGKMLIKLCEIYCNYI